MLDSLINRKNSFLIFVFLFIPFVLSYAIVHQNYNIMFVAATIFLGFIILRSNIISISIILFILFFGNWLEALGLLPGQFIWLVEVIILLLFLKAIAFKIFKGEKINLNLIWIVLLFLVVSLISFILNNASAIHAVLFLRVLFRYYLLFLAVLNLDFDKKSMKLLNNIIIFLFIIQIPTAVVKLFIYGQGETAIGTYAFHGGTYSTVIPLISVSFLIAFYFFYKPSKLYILLVFSFIAFGLIGGKRAVIILVPIVIIFLGFYMRDRLKNVLKYFFVGIVIILLTGYFSMKFVPTLNPQRRAGGEIDIRHLKNFITGYTMSMQNGRSEGRMSTLIIVFNTLRDNGLENLFFGLGPGSYIETRFEGLKTTIKEEGELPINYGITGLTWFALQTGLIGAFIYLSLFYIILIKCLRYYRLEKSPYWKSFGLGMLGFSFIMLFISIFYHPIFVEDLMPMVYFLLVAFTIKIKKHLELQIS